MKKSIIILITFLFALFLWVPKSQAAILMSIEAPSEELVRQQEYDFLVTIDTFGEQVGNIKASVDYQSQYLELVSVNNGNFFNTISHTTPSVGKIELTGSNTSPKAGSGTFAIVRFKLIATAPGSTTLCTVTPITETTPIPSPTTPPSCGQSPCDDTTNPCAAGTTCVKSSDGTSSMCAISQYVSQCTSNMTQAGCCQAPTCGQPCTQASGCGAGMTCVVSGSTGICAMSQYATQCAGNMTQINCCQAILPTAIPVVGSAQNIKIGAILAFGLIGLGIVGMLLL